MLSFSAPLVLPLGLLFLSYCSPARIGRLEVTSIRAWNLEGDYAAAIPTDSYVIIRYGYIVRRTRVIESDHPYWHTTYDLGTVDVRWNLVIEVWDEDLQYDDLLIKCVDEDVIQGSYILTCTRGNSGVEIKYTLRCLPNLSGDKCHRYI